MNIRLTGNPAKADRIRAQKPPVDSTAGERLFRAMPWAGDVDEESREFRAVVATNAPVPRRDGKGPFLEILDPAGLELSADDDIPLLTDHRQAARETVGRASGITVDGPSVSATLRLGQADDIEPIFQRVKDGVIRHVSAGYTVLQWAESKNPDGTRTKTATRWRLLEVSLVPVPADRNAIIQRSASHMPFDTPEARDEFVENIRSLAGLPDAWGDDLPEDADENAIRAAAREALTQRSAPRIRVMRSNDDPALVTRRQSDALVARMGAGDMPADAREYGNMSMLDLARDSLTRSGVSVRGMSADEVLTRAGQHTTSDFGLVVSSAANKVALSAYQAAESPLKVLSRKRSLSNFKESTSIRLGGMGRLEPLTESGEFKATSRAENGETMKLATFGRRFDVSRQLLIDDDLGLLADITTALGQAAAQTEADALFELLTSPPNMSDGKAPFHASRGNLHALAIGSDGLLAVRAAMRKTKDLDGKTIIGAVPKTIVVGPDLEAAAEEAVYLWRDVNIDQDGLKLGKAMRDVQIVVEPRLEASKDWFVFADTARTPTLAHAYLSGAEGVQIQRQESWNTLGLSFRAFLDFGCAWTDWRGAAKSVTP